MKEGRPMEGVVTHLALAFPSGIVEFVTIDEFNDIARRRTTNVT